MLTAHSLYPKQAVCVNGYVKTADGDCAECNGSIALSFVYPALVLLAFVCAAISLLRTGQMQTIIDTAYEAAHESAKEGQDSVIEAAVEDVQEEVLDAAKDAALEVMTPTLLRHISEESNTDCAAGVTPLDVVQIPVDMVQSAPPSPRSNERAPAVATVPSLRIQSSSTSSHSSYKSALQLAAKYGCTRKRIASWQVKVRILISFVQVLSSLGVVFSIPYPAFFDRVVAYMSVFSLDIFTVMPLGCTVDLNHDHYLLMRTLIPIALLCLSSCYRRRLMLLADRDKQNGLPRKAEADEALADQLLTYNFVLVYLLFPSTSANIFATLQCETLDDPAHSRFLRIDFAVNCDTAFHQLMMAYACLMILIYPIGVPVLYLYLLFYRYGPELQLLRRVELRKVALQNDLVSATELQSSRNEAKSRRRSIRKAFSLAIAHSSSDSNRDIQISFSRHTAATSSGAIDKLKLKAQIQKLKAEELTLRTALPDYVQKLILGYELRTYYFEVIESLRKLAIVCLPVFFRPSGSISQLTFGLMVCFLSFGVHALYNPYVKREDDRLAQLCQVTSLRAL